MRSCCVVLSLVLLTACEASPAGGHAGSGGGGDGPGGTGGSGGSGGAVEDPGIPVDLPFVSFGVRTQAWAPDFSPGLPSYRLVLTEDGGGCERLGATHVGPEPHAIELELDRPAVGDCALELRRGDQEGCRFRAKVLLGRGRGFGAGELEPSEGVLRLDRFGEGTIAGELTVRYAADHEQCVGGSSSSDRSTLYCSALDGSIRECVQRSGDDDCCNAGKPLEETTIAFGADLCAAALPCWGTGCVGVEAALACPPPAVDCEEVCAVQAAGCGSCTDCEGDEYCERVQANWCANQAARCPDACAAALLQPGAPVAAACIAAGLTVAPLCGDWDACLAACGTPADRGGD